MLDAEHACDSEVMHAPANRTAAAVVAHKAVSSVPAAAGGGSSNSSSNGLHSAGVQLDTGTGMQGKGLSILIPGSDSSSSIINSSSTDEQEQKQDENTT
eukprot:2884-Heterococcus_DN1.PRE.1